MPTITLADGNNINFPNKVTGLQIAEKISKSLAKQAVVIQVDGQLKDLNYIIDKDCTVKMPELNTAVETFLYQKFYDPSRSYKFQ